MVRGIFAQAILDVGGIACAFQIDAARGRENPQEMNVTIREAGQNKFSSGVDHAECQIPRILPTTSSEPTATILPRRMARACAHGACWLSV